MHSFLLLSTPSLHTHTGLYCSKLPSFLLCSPHEFHIIFFRGRCIGWWCWWVGLLGVTVVRFLNLQQCGLVVCCNFRFRLSDSRIPFYVCISEQPTGVNCWLYLQFKEQFHSGCSNSWVLPHTSRIHSQKLSSYTANYVHCKIKSPNSSLLLAVPPLTVVSVVLVFLPCFVFYSCLLSLFSGSSSPSFYRIFQAFIVMLWMMRTVPVR